MSKDKRQKRFQQKQRHIERQKDISIKVLGDYSRYRYDHNPKYVVGKDEGKSPHRDHKLNALQCSCYMCGNPRKFFGDKTFQEIRFECSAVEQTNRDSIGKWEWEDLNDPAMEW